MKGKGYLRPTWMDCLSIIFVMSMLSCNCISPSGISHRVKSDAEVRRFIPYG